MGLIARILGGRIVHHQPGAPDPDAYRRAVERRRAYQGGSAYDPVIWPVAAGAGVVAAGETDEDEDERDSQSGPGACGGTGFGGGGS